MDLNNNLKIVPGYGPVAPITDNTPMVTAILDTRNFDSNMLAIVAGTLADADATFTLLVEEGDAANLSDAAAVVDNDLIGLESQASFTFADDGVTKKIGYKGKKNYIRATLTPANNTGSAPFTMVWIQGNGRKLPV